MNDSLIFSYNDNDANQANFDPWNILIVDDDIDVHQTTSFALSAAMINRRPLKLIHKFSGEEAINFMKGAAQVDLVLLDMVMETKYAGWEVARWLREDANYPVDPVIILRTGQPGFPSLNDIENNTYFNAVLNKGEVTRNVLIDLFIKALPNPLRVGGL